MQDDTPKPTARWYTVAEPVLLAILDHAAAGEHPGVLVADLYVRASSAGDAAVRITELPGPYPPLGELGLEDELELERDQAELLEGMAEVLEQYADAGAGDDDARRELHRMGTRIFEALAVSYPEAAAQAARRLAEGARQAAELSR